MDCHRLLMEDKLDFSGIFKQTLKLPIKNPNFILLFLINSIPLIFLLLLQEIILLQSLIGALRMLTHHPYFIEYRTSYDFLHTLFSIQRSFENISAMRLFSSLLLLAGIIHVLDLVNTIITVYTASMMYTEEANPMNLKQMLCTPIDKAGFKGPLITSICAFVLSSLTSIGLSTLAINMFMTTYWGCFLGLLFGVLFMALLTKHIEWSAVWNMGVVLSILEDKHGDIAIGMSAYLSRGSRKRGFLLAFVFFAWKLALRISCFYYMGWHGGGIGNSLQVIAGKVSLDCVGNFIMWVAFVVYFNDCKRRLQEKKFDGAEGRVTQTAKV